MGKKDSAVEEARETVVVEREDADCPAADRRVALSLSSMRMKGREKEPSDPGAMCCWMFEGNEKRGNAIRASKFRDLFRNAARLLKCSRSLRCRMGHEFLHYCKLQI